MIEGYPCLGSLIILGVPILIMFLLAGNVVKNEDAGKGCMAEIWRVIMSWAGIIVFFVIGYFMFLNGKPIEFTHNGNFFTDSAVGSMAALMLGIAIMIFIRYITRNK